MKKRIAIVDDHASIRRMLALVLARDRKYEIVGETGSGLEAVTLCFKGRPDLLVLDLALPDLCGIEVMHRILSQPHRPRILVYSGLACQNAVIEALRCHPDGYVDKSSDLSLLLSAIRSVLAGHPYFTPFASKLLRSCQAMTDGIASLTSREHYVLQMIAVGRSTKEIASQLDVAKKTVDNHRQNLMDKLCLHSVAALTHYAISKGLVAL